MNNSPVQNPDAPLEKFFAQESNVGRVEKELVTSGHINRIHLWIIANFPEESIPHLTPKLATHLHLCGECGVCLDDLLDELYCDVTEVRESVKGLLQKRLG